MCGVDVSTSAMQNVSPNLQLRRLSSVPEFTAETAGGPQFTADPGRSTAGMGATDTTTSSTSGKEEAGGWAGGIDDALVQVQEAALSHVVRRRRLKLITRALCTALAGWYEQVSSPTDGQPNPHLISESESGTSQKELGWSNEALVAGARDVDVSPAIAGSLQKGGADLVQVSQRPGMHGIHDRYRHQPSG